MAHLSGSFSSAYAGLLEVTLEGSFENLTGRDAGFPSGNANIMIRGVVNGSNMPSIDRYAPTVKQTFSYPGGGASWALSTKFVAVAYNGTIGAVGFSNLRMTCVLIKR